MPGGTVAFLLQFSLHNEEGKQLYNHMEMLCHSGATQVAGMEVNKERVGRSTLANQIATLLAKLGTRSG